MSLLPNEPLIYERANGVAGNGITCATCVKNILL